MKEEKRDRSGVSRYTEKDLHNIVTFDNGLSLLEEIGQAVIKLPMGHKIRVVNNNTKEQFALTPTLALAFEGITEGAARELCSDGHQDVVDEIITRHQGKYEDDPGVEIILFNDDEKREGKNP